MNDKGRKAASVSIIGGADGPTSVFTVDRTGRKPLKVRIHNYISKNKRKRAEKRIVASSHTLEEVVAYAIDNYGATEVNKLQRRYIECRNGRKESLVMRYKPELQSIFNLDVSNEDSIRNFLQQRQAQSEMIAKIPDSEIPMDFHIYEIKIGDNCLDLEIDYTWNTFGMSYSGSKAVMRRFKEIVQDLYIYYGVSEKDIRDKSERYYSLLSVLSS